MRKKILLCITKSTAGGAQKYVYDLALHLPTDQFEPVIVAGGSGSLFVMAREKGIRTISVQGIERDISFVRELRAFFNLTKIFIKEKPDIIHLNSSKMGAMGAIAALIVKLITFNFKPRVIFTVHGWGFREDRSAFWRMAIFTVSWIAARFHSHTIAINSADYADARAFIPHKKISLVPLGLEKTEFMERDSAREFFSQRYGVPKDKFLIGVAAELIKNKGISYFLQALNVLKNSQIANPIEMHAIIMGEGKEHQRLEIQRQTLGLTDDTSVIGFVPEAKQYLKAFDTFVLPSVKEGLPYAVMEAMAAGLPVVASHVGGIPDLISDQTTGLLTRAKDPRALARQIQYMIDNEDHRRAMGMRAQEKIAQSHPLERMITATANLYHELAQPYQ